MFKLKFYNKAVVCFMAIMALLVIGCGSDCENCVAVVEATWLDARDGQTYKIVTIGSQTWMAENLNYEMPNSACFKNDPSKCEQYGRLYFWAAAMQACPQGWHLPSLEEWKILMDAVGGENVAGSVLKAKTGWRNNGNGSDLYGFSVLPAAPKRLWMPRSKTSSICLEKSAAQNSANKSLNTALAPLKNRSFSSCYPITNGQ